MDIRDSGHQIDAGDLLTGIGGHYVSRATVYRRGDGMIGGVEPRS
jgi:hypothetical protein